MNVGYLLAILGALTLGGYMFVMKQYFAEYSGLVFIAVVNSVAFVWYLPVAVLTVPADGFLPASFDATAGVIFFGTMGFGVLASLTFFRAISIGDLSYVGPLSKIVPVFVLPLEFLLLDEHLTRFQIAGVVLATLAIYVANFQRGNLIEPFKRAATTRSAQLALLSAALFGVKDVGNRVAMQELAIPPQTYLPLYFVVSVAVLSPLAIRQWPADGVRTDAKKFVGMGAFAALNGHLVMLTYQKVSASIGSPILNMQSVVAVVIGGLVLNESHFRIRLVATGLAITGIGLIALGPGLVTLFF
jgi:drug/metabolite transporter (DMT)-like permease